MVETVLSSDKFQLPVLRALKAGFDFGFVFVTVASADLNTARVQHRVATGGHDVPEDRIRQRRVRSHANATWFADRATTGLVYDNSAQPPVPLAYKMRGSPAWHLHDPIRLAQLGIALST